MAKVTVQEGDRPAEAVEKLLPQYEGLMDDLERPIARINKTNCVTPFEDMTPAEAITKRDCLKSTIRACRDLYEAASIPQDRYSHRRSGWSAA